MSFATWSGWRLLGVLALAALAPAVADAAPQPEVVPGQVLVGFRTPSGLQAASLDASRGVAQVLGHQPRLRAVRMRLLPGVSFTAMRERLTRRSDVEYVEPLYIRRAVATPNDTAYSNQWALAKIDADEAWGIWQPQSQVKIAIVDTGIDLTHPDLANLLVRDDAGAVVNFNAQTNSTAAGAANDDNGHGTHCAGTAAGQINNFLGIAGVAGWNPSVPNSNSYIKLLPVKVLDSSGSGNDADVAEGIIWAADQGARIISLSLGGAGSSITLTNATNYALSKGCVVIGAAGNDGVSTKSYPAANTGVISVAATDSSDRLASFSNWGTWVKVAAPGVEIYATYPGARYAWMSGTSMAAPHVAGQAAAILAQNPNLTNTAVENVILDNADPYQSYNGRLLAAGAGRINVWRALEAAGGGVVSVASVTVSPSAVTGGAPATGTVTLTGTAPTGGTAVALVSDLPSAAVPSSVQVLAGQLTASFQVTTTPVSVLDTATISATVGADVRTAPLQVRPPTPTSLTFSPSAVNSGESATGTVLLSGPAPAGGAMVALSSGNAVVTVPAAVTVSAGATSATFTAVAGDVSVDTAVTLSATYASVSRSVNLTVRGGAPAATLASVTLSATSVIGGGSVVGTVTLDSAAPVGGVSVALAATGLAAVPSSVVVAAGATTATFNVTTSSTTTSSAATVRATYNAVIRTASLTIEPVEPTFQFVLTPSTLRGGKSAVGTVTLAAPAPVGGTVFAVSSNNTAATVPVSVTVRSGSRKANFTVRTFAVSSSRVAQITVTSVGGTRTAPLTINPPSVKRVTLKSARVRGGAGTVATVLLDGPSPAEGLALTVTADQSAVVVPQTVMMVGGRSKVTFKVRTSSVSSTVVAGISVSVSGAPGSTRLTILPSRAVQRARVTRTSVRQPVARATR